MIAPHCTTLHAGFFHFRLALPMLNPPERSNLKHLKPSSRLPQLTFMSLMFPNPGGTQPNIINFNRLILLLHFASIYACCWMLICLPCSGINYFRKTPGLHTGNPLWKSFWMPGSRNVLKLLPSCNLAASICFHTSSEAVSATIGLCHVVKMCTVVIFLCSLWSCMRVIMIH